LRQYSWNKFNILADSAKRAVSSAYKGRLPTNIHFKYGDKELEIVKDVLYLGIKFSRSGSFRNAKKKLANRGTKAMYEVLKRGRLHNLSISYLKYFEYFLSIMKNHLLKNCCW
jgi:hypothetical protein